MAKQTNSTKASVCYKAGMFLILMLTLASCEKAASPQPPKVLKVVSRTNVFDKGSFRIKKIGIDGTVFVGRPDLDGATCEYGSYRLRLRGKAQVGDAFALIVSIEDRLLETGKIETHITKIEVISKRNEEYEKIFKDAKEEGKPPESKNQAEGVSKD